ncbi:hypothetical protein GM182_00655 [bacterium 3DAC]|nr:hypothetical protein GM182_00655 [bacterium 3DAC]
MKKVVSITLMLIILFVACGAPDSFLSPYSLVPLSTFNVKLTLLDDEATSVWGYMTGCNDKLKSLTLYMSTTTVNVSSHEFWNKLVIVGTATTDVDIMVPYAQTASHVWMSKKIFYTLCGTMLCLSSDEPYMERKPIKPSLEPLARVSAPDVIDMRVDRHIRFTGTISISSMDAEGYLYLDIPLSTLPDGTYKYAFLPKAEMSISVDGSLLNALYSYYKGLVLKYFHLSSAELVWLDSTIDILKNAYIHVDISPSDNEFLLSVYFLHGVPASFENALYFVKQRYPHMYYMLSDNMLVLSTTRYFSYKEIDHGTAYINIGNVAALYNMYGDTMFAFLDKMQIKGVIADISYISKDALFIHVSLKR